MCKLKKVKNYICKYIIKKINHFFSETICAHIYISMKLPFIDDTIMKAFKILAIDPEISFKKYIQIVLNYIPWYNFAKHCDYFFLLTTDI